jgi:hypothetical protein
MIGYAPIRELVLALAPGPRLLTMLAAYYDESGTDGHSRSVVVAAYVSTVSQWERFQREWQGALSAEQVTVFHMKDFAHRRGEFRGWEEPRRRLLQKLLVTIGIRTQYRVATALNLDDYQAVFQTDISPYAFCVVDTLKRVGRWVNRYAPDDRVAHFFERGTGHGREITSGIDAILDDSRNARRYRIDSYTFARKELSPLQAADLFAYEARKYIEDMETSRKLRKSFELLIGTATHELHYYDRDALSRLSRQMP